MIESLFRDDDLHDKLESLADQMGDFERRLADLERGDAQSGAESGAVPSQGKEVHQDPNSAFHSLMRQQRDLRQAVAQRGLRAYLPDEEMIAEVCRDYNQQFDGAFIFAYGNEFGRPAVFLPSGREAKVTLTAVLDAVYEHKWDATDRDLRRARRDILDLAGDAIHKSMPAVVSAAHEVEEPAEEERISLDGGMAVRYDITPSVQSNEYNWLTIREPVGLLAYVANSDQTSGLTVRY